MSEENDDSSGDDLSGLSGFFFYMFIVHPATAWILRPGRFERKKSIMYAIAFLAALAAIKTGKFARIIARNITFASSKCMQWCQERAWSKGTDYQPFPYATTLGSLPFRPPPFHVYAGCAKTRIYASNGEVYSF